MYKQHHYGPRALSRFDYLGIRFVEGEDGANPTTGQGGEQPPANPPAQPAPTPQPPAQQTPPAQPAPPTQPPAQPIQYKGNPDEYVRELREEAKTHRLAAEKATSDFEAAQKERDALTAERDSLARERALLLNAPKHGARADLLLDSSSFMKTFADVDLTDEEAVKTAITNAVEKNSTFRAKSLPATSGGGHQGGGTPKTNISLEGAVKSRLGG
ncbi:hypothetical protein GCM10010915_11910 [Microbacterium faecale]|uniref:Scaffolding protein n=2 Tax=Microbacterium faecale TaxID=1804630 RepID=A0A916Y840_9MICO|nr:hypothetical protein GCM10010915_11910 [Microbacterium faecale]